MGEGERVGWCRRVVWAEHGGRGALPLGSLSTDAVKSTYGVEEERLGACREIVEVRAGSGQTEQWVAAGCGLGLLEVLSFARAAVEQSPA